jgi:hypothetical protein
MVERTGLRTCTLDLRPSRWKAVGIKGGQSLRHVQLSDLNGRDVVRFGMGGRADTRTATRVHVSIWIARSAQRVDAAHIRNYFKMKLKMQI